MSVKIPKPVSVGLTLLCALLAGLLFTSGTALAAAPEEPLTGTAEPVTNTTALLQGVVNPKSQAIAAWFFQYNEGAVCTGGSTTPVHPAEEVEAQSAEAPLSNLKPGTQYTFCLVASNEAEEVKEGKPVSFTTTVVAPTVTEESFSSVTSTEASVTAQVNAEGVSATYRVEHGTSEPYASSGEASLPAAEGAVGVLVHLTGLTPSTEYHFRFVAHSALGTMPGSGELTFKTGASGGESSLTLPDNRAYELVSPVHDESNLEVDAPLPPGNYSTLEDHFSEQVYRASMDGNAVAYGGDPPSSEGNGSQGGGIGNQYVAVRTSRGWQASDVTPVASPASPETGYRAFSSDLSTGFVITFNSVKQGVLPLTADAPANCSVVYSRNASGYRALFSSTETPGFCGTPVFAGGNAGTSAVPGYSHLLFETEAALTEPAVAAEAEEDEYNLYESVNGQVRLVNVLPGGEPDPNATFGGPSSTAFGTPEPGEEGQPDFSNVISADGSRVFWTDRKTGNLYVREDATVTVPVSAGAEAARFWTATPDGRYAFYTEGEKLWRFDMDAKTRVELAGTGAAVKGVIGINETGEDGAYVYFVAGGVLADNENIEKEKAESGNCQAIDGNSEEQEGRIPSGHACNVYVLNGGGSPTFIATLSANNNNFSRLEHAHNGDWQASLGNRTAEVTPDGRHLVFTARQRLTGYNNLVRNESQLEGAPETFVYDAGSGRISCASCNPTGEPPTPIAALGAGSFTADVGAVEPVAWIFRGGTTFMHRWINEAGTMVFFSTAEALVPQDTNGYEDAYEWEQEGSAPSCPEAARPRADGGCLFLLSGGQKDDASAFVDASADGSDAFFTTRERLAPQDMNENMDLYDARVNGGFTGFSLACTGTGCQGVPPAPPIFATPSSVTFNGVGNFQVPAAAATKPKAKPKRCKRGFVKKRGRCVIAKKGKARRGSKRGRK